MMQKYVFKRSLKLWIQMNNFLYLFNNFDPNYILNILKSQYFEYIQSIFSPISKNIS